MWRSSCLFKSVTPNRTLQRGEKEENQKWREETMKGECCIRLSVQEINHLTPFPVQTLTAVGVMPDPDPRVVLRQGKTQPPICLLTLIRGKICVYFQITRESFAWKWAKTVVWLEVFIKSRDGLTGVHWFLSFVSLSVFRFFSTTCSAVLCGFGFWVHVFCIYCFRITGLSKSSSYNRFPVNGKGP